MSKIIKVGTVPGRIQEVAVEENVTVKEAVELAGFSLEGYEIKLNGRTASETTKITSTTETILLVKKVKGNAPQIVKIGTVPGRIQELAVETGTLISEAIEMAGFSSEGYEVKVDGRTASTSAKVASSTSTILLVKKVKGNR